ncbi:unnamed protein product [Bathycoccus prasinos]
MCAFNVRFKVERNGFTLTCRGKLYFDVMMKRANTTTKKKGREEDELVFKGTVEPFYSSAHPVTPAEAYGFAGIVLSTVLFFFHLYLLFSPNPREDQKETNLTTKTKSEHYDDDTLVRFIMFSKHYAKAFPLWMALAVCMYMILIECLSRVKVLSLDDGRLFTYRRAASRASSSDVLRRRRRRRKAGEEEEEEKETKIGGGGGGVIGESVDVRAWNEALFRRPS